MFHQKISFGPKKLFGKNFVQVVADPSQRALSGGGGVSGIPIMH